MKSFLLCTFASLISIGAVNAGAIGCKKNSTASTTIARTTPTTRPIPTLSAIKSVPTTASVQLQNYLPIFFDDFDGTPGSLPSEDNWIFDLGTQYPGGAVNWGNSEKEVYTKNTANIHLTTSSTLLITPLKNTTTTTLKNGSTITNTTWTSARIETQRTDFKCPPDRKLFIQARIKLGTDPVIEQQGIWPAFWALGKTFRSNVTSWPMASEIDIMESTNGLSYNSMTIHCGTAPDGPCNEYDGISSRTNITRGIFNTYGFEIDRTPGNWTQESLSWYLNGNKAFTILGSEVGDYDAWKMLARKEHFLLLNVAVGGSVADVFSLNGTTPTGRTKGGEGSAMEVDYVGVWVSPEVPCLGNVTSLVVPGEDAEAR